MPNISYIHMFLIQTSNELEKTVNHITTRQIIFFHLQPYEKFVIFKRKYFGLSFSFY